MRLTEYMHYLTRDDIGLGQNPKLNDYTHYIPSVENKRERYLYQCRRKGKKPVK